MQFCCDLKDKGKFLKSTFVKALAILMVLVFSCISILQYHHHHDPSEGDSSSSYNLVIKKAEHCKVCDHFLHHRDAALIPSDFVFKISSQTSKVVKGGFHILSDYSTIVNSFTNKGPPTA